MANVNQSAGGADVSDSTQKTGKTAPSYEGIGVSYIAKFDSLSRAAQSALVFDMAKVVLKRHERARTLVLLLTCEVGQISDPLGTLTDLMDVTSEWVCDDLSLGRELRLLGCL